jgi:hypothetical protein
MCRCYSKCKRTRVDRVGLPNMRNMKTEKQRPLLSSPERSTPPTDGRNGHYHCDHCGDTVMPSTAQIELAENAPEPNPALKCPHCHRHTVHWRMPSPQRNRPRPQPVSVAHGRELFAGISRMLAEI